MSEHTAAVLARKDAVTALTLGTFTPEGGERLARLRDILTADPSNLGKLLSLWDWANSPRKADKADEAA